MKVFYDGAIFSIQKYGGINRYFKNLIEYLPEHVQATLVTSAEPFPVSSRHNVLSCSAPPWLSWQKSLRRFVEARIARKHFLDGQPDIIHPTYNRSLTRNYFENFSSGKQRAPVVLTIYDFTHERYGDQIKNAERQVAWKSAAIKQADAIICISQSTMNDLAEYHPDAVNKAVVIHLADELGAVEANSQGIEQALTEKYFLFVGGRSEYKNFLRLLEATRILHRAAPEYRLFCVGAPLSSDEVSVIDQLGLGGVVESFGRVDDAQLKMLYQQCVAFVYPSLYEGFGIPLLESMGCGAPILASNSSCFPEILDGVGMLFDPLNVQEIADKMLQVARGEFDRQKSVEQGFERYCEFSWERVAQETCELYSGLL